MSRSGSAITPPHPSLPASASPKHAPLPWFPHSHEALKIKDADGNTVASMFLVHLLGIKPPGEAAASRALIVTAVNCHHDLVEALTLLVADVAGYPAWERPCHALDVARAALAKAQTSKPDTK